jgi:uncharacterized protein
MWEGLELRLVQPLQVELAGHYAGDGVLVRGSMQTSVEMDCRRCLEVVRTPIDQEIGLWFQSAESAEGDDEAYTLPERGTELDLTEAVREQLVLAAPTYALCSEDCRGLCPKCGANRNEAPCECAPDEGDSPWSVLKNIALD